MTGIPSWPGAWRRLPIFFSIVLLAACQAGGQRAYDDIAFVLSPDWTVGNNQVVQGRYALTEWVRTGDDIADWDELVTVQNWTLSAVEGANPEAFLRTQQQLTEKNCPGAATWRVLERDARSILYETRTKACMGYAEHHQIGRIIDGKYNRFEVSYAMKGAEIPPQRRAEWLGWAADVTVVTNTR